MIGNFLAVGVASLRRNGSLIRWAENAEPAEAMSIFYIAPQGRRCWGLFRVGSMGYKRLVGPLTSEQLQNVIDYITIERLRSCYLERRTSQKADFRKRVFMHCVSHHKGSTIVTARSMAQTATRP